MKKFSCALICFCYAITNLNAQNLLTPADAEMIVTIRAGEMFDKMSLNDIENMPYLKGYFEDMFQSIGHEVKSLADMGVDVTKSSQLFIDVQDDNETVMMGMSLPITDAARFKYVFDFENQTVKSLGGAESIVKGGLSIVMNGQTALLTYALENPNRNNYNYYYDDIYVEEAEPAYELEAPEEVIEYEEPEFIDDDVAMPMEEMEEIEETEVEEIYETDEIEYTEEIVETDDYDYDAYYEQQAREREEQMKKEMEAQTLVTETYVLNLLSNFKLNASAPDYSAYEVDEKADFSILIKDYANIMGMYQNWYSNPYGYKAMGMMAGEEIFTTMSDGIEYLTGNGYFRKEGIEIEFKQKFNDDLAELNRELAGEFNPEMLKYIPFESEIGHMSVAINTENAINAYYDIMETYMGVFMPSEKESMETAIAFAKIMIDEEALGNLVKGDAYFGVTDLNSYEVEYTTYEYDDNWNSTEVTKTKQEIRPDFLFMFSSEEYDFTSKIMNVLSIQTGDEFKNMGDYYMMKASRNVPLDIYSMHKDGIVFVFTSQSLFDSIMKGGSKAKSSESKILTDNVMSMNFNAQKLFSKIPLADISEQEKEMILSARENLGEIRMTQGKIEGNTLTSNIFMETTGDYSNSLEYFMSLFNEFGRIENDFRYNRN